MSANIQVASASNRSLETRDLHRAIFIGASIFLFLSILANKISEKYGIPALLLFLFVGMLAGSEGPGGIFFDSPELAQAMGVTALTLILFSGGLDTQWSDVRPVALSGLVLSTLGVVITAAMVGLAAHYLAGFSFLEGMLLGAIMSSTDAAAVFSVLRAQYRLARSGQTSSRARIGQQRSDGRVSYGRDDHLDHPAGRAPGLAGGSAVFAADGFGSNPRLYSR